ncbi:ABC transporter ATP-binding protein [Streptomyces profundus]|uniref:ABC transporter ATP-binding protein n=1 Tax=Streptomyces profundus TaxID=2867410 RepID=UPI001D16BB48|nr:ABC transporter ATP-binding protein [Streptomyces sp. MA3_2.13]UED86752.1 ABC transporter ATP-binding protein [Streptomyces sp. MA3_2.13]
MSRLSAKELRVGHGARDVLTDLDFDVPDAELTVIIGPNACGKSTLLHALSRLHAARGGSVLLDGKDIRRYGAKEVARRVGLLPQSPLAPDGITVHDLVSRGRYPHQGVLRSWSDEDAAAVADALRATGVADLAQRRVDQLSGGQRQRVWIAMAVAQETPLLLLDEPTTYLDIGHQVEVLRLMRELRNTGRTVVAVLHEINHAARYATHLVAMHEGRVIARGDPRDIVTPELIETMFGLPSRVLIDEVTGAPIVVPEETL